MRLIAFIFLVVNSYIAIEALSIGQFNFNWTSEDYERGYKKFGGDMMFVPPNLLVNLS